VVSLFFLFFFFSSRRRHTRLQGDWSSDVCSSDLPSPAVLHFRGGRKSISKEVYPDLDAFYEDLGKTYRKAVKAFYDAGCRYLQRSEERRVGKEWRSRWAA